jgi:hypothetical protein
MKLFYFFMLIAFLCLGGICYIVGVKLNEVMMMKPMMFSMALVCCLVSVRALSKICGVK